VAELLHVAREPRERDRVILPKTALAAIAACFLLMGAEAAAYGPLLEQLARRFSISLPVASEVFSAHFAGALVGVFALMWGTEHVTGRISIWVSLGCLGVGFAGVALAFSWATFLIAVLVVGLGFGGLDIGLNLLVAQSEGRGRTALLNALNGAYGLGAVAGPILISSLGRQHFATVYTGGAVLAAILVPAVAGISGRLPFKSRDSVPPTSGGTRGQSRRGGLLVAVFVVAFVFYVGVETGVGGWMASHLESVGIRSADAASLTSGFWLAFAAGRLLAALIPDRAPPAAVVLTGSAIASVALLVALNARAAPIAYIVTGLAIAPIFPTSVVWLTRLRPGDSRSTSWLFPAAMIGGGVIPPSVGFAVSWLGIGWTPAVLSAVAIVTLAMFSLASLDGREYRPPKAAS
jgi:FHS family glucose/mannose:H+ symporter-like MFS transporter